jgi:hypothetical protein
MKLRDPKSSRLNPKRRPLSLVRSTTLIWTILPSIAIVAALFVAFSYISYFLREYLGEEEVSVRSIDGVVVRSKTIVEQTPPPSPEAAMEEFERKLEAERAAQNAPTPDRDPIFEPVEEPEVPIELMPLEIAPLGVPGLADAKSP